MLMPIGQFATASRLSVKSLRNYDESGLLPASFVDPQSGYRYYRLEQLARADAIRSLRMVGMPLARIAETLDGEDPELLLMSQLETLEAERDEINRKALHLQRLIATKEYVMSSEVIFKTIPAQTAAAYRTETTYDKIFAHIPEGFGRVMGFLGGSNVGPIGAPFTLYYEAPDGDTTGEIAMCVPIAGAMDVHDGISIVELEACAAAAVIHKGSYETMGESYANAANWIVERGHHIVGPAREIYMNSPADTPEEDLLTEILFPIDAELAA